MNLSIIPVLLASSILLAAADPLADVFARMDKAAQNFHGMTADIKETVHTEIVNDNTDSNGTIKLKRARANDVKVLVEFTNPDAPRAVALAGAEARLYNPKTKTVQEYDVSNSQHLMEQLFLLGFGATSSEIKQNYDVTWVGAESVDGKPGSHLKLIPKSADVLQKLKEADLWISDSQGLPMQQKFFTASSGDYTLFKYSNLQIANNLSDKDVQLKLPKDVQTKRVGR